MKLIRRSARLLAVLFAAIACLVGSIVDVGPTAAADSDRPATQSQQPKQPNQSKQAKESRQTKPAEQARQPTRPQAAGPAREPSRPVPIPQGCADLAGVHRQICIECDSVALHKRVICQQQVFWTTCKGKRLLEDSYCQSLQEQRHTGRRGRLSSGLPRASASGVPRRALAGDQAAAEVICVSASGRAWRARARPA